MKKYDNYKDSGIEWIGEIPEHWDVKRIGSNCLLTVPQRDKPKDLNGEIPWLRIEDFEGKYISESKSGQGVSIETINEMNLKVYPVGTVLTACSCTMGKTAIVTKPLITNQTFIGITPNENLYSDFLYYFLISSTQYLNSISTGAIQSYLSRDEFSKIKIPFPILEEQTQIANYLDHKTTQIDILISKKQQFISLLQEERIVVINQAVTKGLDPKVTMKDSGIEWLGEIPEHWGVKKLKYLCKIINEKSSEKPDYVLALENIKSWTGEIIGNPYENKMEGDVNLFKENDILFNKLRPYLAKVIKTQSDGGCVGELLVLRAYKFLTPTFLYYRLISEAIITIVDNSTYGTKMPRASWEKFISLIGIGFPSIDEQNKITDYIENKIREIETLISKTQQEIELLKEYKTALISEVVTGKVDVREEVLN